MYNNNKDSEEEDRIENLKNQEIGTRSNKKEIRKRKDKRKKRKQRKKKKRKGKEKKQRELVPQTCTNRLFPSLPLKILPSTKSKEKGSSRH